MATKPDKAALACPRCGQQQLVSRMAFSAVCKGCGEYLRVQELLKPAPKPAGPAPQQRTITCFECGAEFTVPANAQSSMCKRCSGYIDLHDYNITNAVSRNFKTKGVFVVQPTGYVFNTEAVVRQAVIKGRFLGKLFAEESLTLHSTADIKGSISAARLIIPAGNKVRWNGELQVGAAEIEGELIANLKAQSSILIKPHGVLLGTVQSQSLHVEQGGTLVGQASVKPSGAEAKLETAPPDSSH